MILPRINAIIKGRKVDNAGIMPVPAPRGGRLCNALMRLDFSISVG
jgi:hypothetical protein